MPLLKPIPVLLALALLITSAGCSRMQIAYNAADLLILHEAADYLDLAGNQQAEWKPTLETALSRHRDQELPYVAAFFDSALTGARDGFTPARMTCLLDQFETIYQRNFRLAAAAAAPLLAALTSAQVDALARTFAKDAREDAPEPGPKAAAARVSERAKRYAENLDWWLGPLDARQRGIIREVTRRMPDTGPAWYTYRDQKRTQLLALLREGAGAARIEAFLIAWVVDYQDMPASLRGARDDLRTAFADLFLQLQPTFSPAQRTRFISRLETLRDDCLALQKHPRKAAAGC